MRTVAIIQARMSSSRLPGKVLADLAGTPAIILMIERLRAACTLDATIVATSLDASDDPLAESLDRHGVRYCRGSLDDVLARYVLAADETRADRIVRLTGDCPLIDADVIDCVAALVDAECDYASNIAPPSFPDGLDCEAFTRGALDAAQRHAVLRSDREHVTPWMRRENSGLRCRNIASHIDMSSLRWTIDYPDDLAHIRQLLAEVGKSPVGADRFDFLRITARLGSDWAMQRHTRNEGFAKSLHDEKGGR